MLEIKEGRGPSFLLLIWLGFGEIMSGGFYGLVGIDGPLKYAGQVFLTPDYFSPDSRLGLNQKLTLKCCSGGKDVELTTKDIKT